MRKAHPHPICERSESAWLAQSASNTSIVPFSPARCIATDNRTSEIARIAHIARFAFDE
jgi:hypothetical protein